MRNFWLILIIAICFAHTSHPAEQVTDFSGTWLLDPEHSQMDLSAPETGKLKINVGGSVSVTESGPESKEILPDVPPASRMRNLSLRIVQTEGSVQVMRQFLLDGKDRTVLQKFTTDGSQCINLSSDGMGEFISRSNWKKDKLIHSGIQNLSMQRYTTEAHVTEEYSLSGNKKKLTIKTMSTMPQGTIKLKQEFLRQENDKP